MHIHPPETIDIGLVIRQKMDEYDISVAWLARRIGADRSNLAKQLQQKHIYPELLYAISVALQTDFFASYSTNLSSG
jgi:hypothetical protein